MVNKVIFQGRLTKDPELRKTQSDVSLLIFTVAWSKKYKEVENKCFLLCKAWRYDAENIAKFFGKGQEIVIEGHMQSEEWKEGETTPVCIVDRWHFAGSKANRTPEPDEKPAATADDFMDLPAGDLEELPFS